MFLPINLNIQDRLCVLVGGGRVARRKCRKLVEHGARVRVVAPDFLGGEEAWREAGVELARRLYGRECLQGAFLAIAATDDPQINQQVAEDAAALGVLIQRVDLPEAGDFTFPATLRRGEWSVSFATGGVIPAMSARMKAEAAATYGEAYGEFCRLVRALKEEPAWAGLDGAQREEALVRLAASDALDLLRHEGAGAAYARMQEIVNEMTRTNAEGAVEPATAQQAANGQGVRPGKVFLVGAGPGDPGLLTLKGAEALGRAEVVLHDALANPALIERHAPQAERIDVSKWKGCCKQTQQQINDLLVAQALAGRTVVRLKGGDPYIFGRGSEEARALVKAGITFEVVPGVSSIAAVPAYAGIPITDREYASSFGVYSLHKKGGVGLEDEEWKRMAAGPQTLVLLMGKTVLETIARKLVEYGRPAATPAALITRGTTPAQKRLIGTLGDIARRAAEESDLSGPGLVVVGDVVRAAEAIDWFHPWEDDEDAAAIQAELKLEKGNGVGAVAAKQGGAP